MAIQANKTNEKLLLTKEEATRYVVRVFHINQYGDQLRDAPEHIFYYKPKQFIQDAKRLGLVGKGYEVLHDPTIKAPKAKAETSAE